MRHRSAKEYTLVQVHTTADAARKLLEAGDNDD